MIGTVLLWAVAGTFFAVTVFLWLNRIAHFRERTIYDVPELLRCIDEAAEQNLFDIDDEITTRLQCGPGFFRRKQRYRLDLAAETYVSRYHNQRIILDWLNTEHYDIRRYHTEDEYGESALQQMEIAREQGKRFCRLAGMIIVKIRILSLLLYLDRINFLYTPSVAAMRRMGRADMLEIYSNVKRAAVNFALVYGEDQSKLLQSRL